MKNLTPNRKNRIELDKETEFKDASPKRASSLDARDSHSSMPELFPSSTSQKASPPCTQEPSSTYI